MRSILLLSLVACTPVSDTPCERPYWLDADGDSYGGVDAEVVDACEPPSSSHVTNGTDCDDDDPSIFPGAREILNDGIDQNCDGATPSQWVGGKTSCQVAPGPMTIGWLSLPLLLGLRRRR